MRSQTDKTTLTLMSTVFSLIFGRSLFAQPIRVQDEDAKKAAIQKVEPAYSPIARQMNLTGRVRRPLSLRLFLPLTMAPLTEVRHAAIDVINFFGARGWKCFA
jgi:hypothetical protein